eukprot:112575-Amphidinium_carterae.1
MPIEQFCGELESPGFRSSLLIGSESEIHVKSPWTNNCNVVARIAGGHTPQSLCRICTWQMLDDSKSQEEHMEFTPTREETKTHLPRAPWCKVCRAAIFTMGSNAKSSTVQWKRNWTTCLRLREMHHAPCST